MLKLHDCRQKEAKSTSNHVTELKTLHDAATLVDGLQGILKGGEAYKELEKLCCESKGILKPSEGEPETSSRALVETTPDPTASSEDKEGRMKMMKMRVEKKP